MADSYHATLVAATITTITINAPGRIEVVNVDGAAAVYFTTDGTAPVIEAEGTQVLPAAITGLEMNPRQGKKASTQVKLISSGTPKVSVRNVS